MIKTEMIDKFNSLIDTDLPRFWDSEKSEMIYPELDSADRIRYKVTFQNDSLMYIELGEMLLVSRFVRMKPVNLKDKNKNPIYEGDIGVLKDYRICGCNKCVTQDYFFVVECKDNEFEFKSITKPKGGCHKGREIYFTKWHLRNAEFLGNIYENPELLKEDK